MAALLIPGACTDADPADDTGQRVDDGATAAVELTLTPVAEGEFLTAMAVRPGDPRRFVAERAGQVVAIDLDGETEVVLDLSEEVAVDEPEQGLLGLTFAPTGTHLYVTYVTLDNRMVLAEFMLVDDVPDVATRRSLLEISNDVPVHYGGMVTFGPDDVLWLSVGDDTSLLFEGELDPQHHRSQDPQSLHGKLLRIDPSRGDPYAIPDDNPFVEGGGAPEVWSMGLRNPWRFSFDRATGDLWIADVGDASWEEVNHAPAPEWGRGANYGWPYFEASHRFADGDPPTELEDPLFEYPTTTAAPEDPDQPSGCAIIGGYVYRGEQVPGLRGEYLFADFCAERFAAFPADDPEGAMPRLVGPTTGAQPTSFGEDADGELYVLTASGEVLRIDPG